MSRLVAVVGSAADPRRAPLEAAARRAADAPRDAGWRAATCPTASVAVAGSAADAVEHEGLLVGLTGRIYNRDELGTEGSDARALARLVRRRGIAAAMRAVNADAAVVVHDARSGRTWLARDRFGLSPLYHASRDGLAVAASRPRALRALPGLGVEPDPVYVARIAGSHYRLFDNEPERSPYLGVAQVPAAHVVTLDGGRAGRYWTLPGDGPIEADEAELAERYRELLLDAVRRRLAVAARPAFTLSGGMDSSSVLACAARLAGPQDAFSSVYEDPTYDERVEIAPMLDAATRRWTPVEIGSPDVLAIVEEMVAEHDEPVATATWLSHRLLAAAVADHGATTLFGGLGGDELNAGEFEYFPFHFADLRAAGRTRDLDREIAEWARHHDHPIFRKDRAVAESAIDRLTDPARPGACLPDRARLDRYVGALAPESAALVAGEPVMEHPFATCLANRTWQDLTRETLPCCVRAEDRNLVPLGVERVHPFLDHRLVELMFRVPGDMKIRNGITKRLLREAMRGVLPEPTRTRIAKTGWNAPAHRWFTGPGRDGLMDLVRSQSFRERGIYRQDEVERLIGEHDQIVGSGAPRENHMMFLWQLANVELWLRDVDSCGPARGNGDPLPTMAVTT